MSSQYTETFDWGNISSEDFDNMADDITNFSYQGLDVKVIFERMQAIGGEDLKADVRTLCLWIVMRGTQIGENSKALNRTNSDGVDRISQLVTKYGIISTRPSRREDISMGRVAATFPHVILGIRFSFLKVGKELRTVGDIPDGLPEALAFPTGAALIPTDNDDLYDKWLEWAISFDEVINGENADSDSVESYARIMHENNPMNDETRGQLVTPIINENARRKKGKDTAKQPVPKGKMSQEEPPAATKKEQPSQSKGGSQGKGGKGKDK